MVKWTGTSNSVKFSVRNIYVTVTDGNNCIAVDSVVVGEDNAVDVTASVVPVGCNGDVTGSITITNATDPIAIYAWSNGVVSGSANSISGLAAGTYTLTVTTASGCEASFSYDNRTGCFSINIR